MKNRLLLLFAFLVPITLLIGCASETCEGYSWEPKTLAESIDLPPFSVKMTILVNNKITETKNGTINFFSISESDRIGLLLHYGNITLENDANRESITIRLVPVSLSGEIRYVYLYYDAPGNFTYNSTEYTNTDINVAGYVGERQTRCSPIEPGDSYIVDLTFKFRRPAADGSSEYDDIKIIVERI